MNTCHGCEGKGWVDGQYSGIVKCPICGGTGKLNTTIQTTYPSTKQTKQMVKKQSIHMQSLEAWLQTCSDVKLKQHNKTMNTYASFSKIKGRWIGLVWVSTTHDNRIYLRKGDYTSVDKLNRVIYQSASGGDTWGGYPQFVIQTQADVAYAIILINYAKNNF
ncbi:hypothetical protein [Dehalococcoides sp. THU4]|uniref:hypothetical protein n=1 Tax=Dehalococcoides sp. THU4 TaxID=3348344 RepID=UPI0037230E67